MSKKHFIELADAIRDHNTRYNAVFGVNAPRMLFNVEQIDALADFCKSQNSAFMRGRWIAYINGECGKNGGKVKVTA